MQPQIKCKSSIAPSTATWRQVNEDAPNEEFCIKYMLRLRNGIRYHCPCRIDKLRKHCLTFGSSLDSPLIKRPSKSVRADGLVHRADSLVRACYSSPSCKKKVDFLYGTRIQSFLDSLPKGNQLKTVPYLVWYHLIYYATYSTIPITAWNKTTVKAHLKQPNCDRNIGQKTMAVFSLFLKTHEQEYSGSSLEDNLKYFFEIQEHYIF